MPEITIDDTTINAESRPVYSSQHYIETTSTDVFANFDVDVATECEETREDCVKIDMGQGERYEIYPATKARVVVKHYFEAPADSSDAPVRGVAVGMSDLTVSSLNDTVHDSPTDRDLKNRSGRLLQYERVTDDPDMWAELEWMRTAPERVTFELPRGETLAADKRKTLKELFDYLVADDIGNALHCLAEYQQPAPKRKSRVERIVGRVVARL